MSILETVLHSNLEDMFQKGKHSLIVGRPRSGKTSFLLYCTAVFFKLGEYVVVRDIGEFYEWFSMLNHGYPILGHVPEGCRILFDHPNFEQVEFDVADLNTLFNNFDKDRINLVFFESFSIEMKNHVQFWSDFFKLILPWKEQPGNGAKQFCLVMDEFGDLAPGKGRTYLRGQNRLSQLIAVNHRKFRRHNIRLVSAVHFFRDITPPIRERFDCYCIRNNYPNPQEVPYTLQNYAHLFPKLPINKMIFVDSSKGFNEFVVREEIKPERFYNVDVQGIQLADKLMEKAKPKTILEKRAETWKNRAIAEARKNVENGESMRDIAERWGITDSAVYMFLSGKR